MAGAIEGATMRHAATLVLAFSLLLIATDAASAQSACSAGPATDNSLDRIVDLYRNCARQWEASLGGFALRLFWLLAAIEFAWSGIRLAFRNADLNEWLAELVNQVFFLGLFLALLTNATAWTGAIVESFRSAGAAALRANGVAAGIAPSDIFDTRRPSAPIRSASTSTPSTGPGASDGAIIGGQHDH
jgi:type IV secretion system protein TrbL